VRLLAKKRRVKRDEEVLVPEPDEYIEAPAEPEPVETAPTVIEVTPKVESAPSTCLKCGLPKAEFEATYLRLRPDLQVKYGRSACPRCGEPTEPF